MWSQALVSIPFLLVLAFVQPLENTWIPILLFSGILGYVGDLWFFHVLEHVDVSVSNIAWFIVSLLLAFSGLLFFGESWGFSQFIGALLVIVGALTLSFYHQKINLRHTLKLILILALLYFPYYLLKKIAIEHDQTPFSVFFWMIAGREMIAFSVPWFFPEVRKAAFLTMADSRHFMWMNAAVISAFFFAEYTGALAYASGPLSLVTIAGNVQPFFVLGLAGLVLRFAPSKAAKELFTRQSIQLKLSCFILVFLGLALLAGSQ